MQQRKISWPDLWWADSYCISFLVQAFYDTLQAQQTLTPGVRVRHLPAPCVLEEDPFITSSAAAPRHWLMVATAGAMTRCLRQLQKQSPQPYSQADTTPERIPLPFLRAGEKLHYRPQTNAGQPFNLQSSGRVWSNRSCQEGSHTFYH